MKIFLMCSVMAMLLMFEAGCAAKKEVSTTSTPTAASTQRVAVGEDMLVAQLPHNDHRPFLVANHQEFVSYTKAEILLRKELAKEIDVAFEKENAEKVFANLSEKIGGKLDVRWDSLEAAGVERDTQITMQLKGVAVKTILEAVLRQAGRAAELEPIGFQVRAGAVLIDTKRELNKFVQLAVYDIRELIYAPAITLPNKNLPRGNITIQLYFEDQTAVTSLFGEEEFDDYAITPEEMIEQITQLISRYCGRAAQLGCVWRGGE
jgi:hypothetical protein